MELSQEKAPREFDNVKAIENYFGREPVRLIQYVHAALKADVWVLSTHLVQLSELVRIPLESKGERALVSSRVFVPLNRFSNINTILSLARDHFLIE